METHSRTKERDKLFVPPTELAKPSVREFIIGDRQTGRFTYMYTI